MVWRNFFSLHIPAFYLLVFTLSGPTTWRREFVLISHRMHCVGSVVWQWSRGCAWCTRPTSERPERTPRCSWSSTARTRRASRSSRTRWGWRTAKTTSRLGRRISSKSKQLTSADRTRYASRTTTLDLSPPGNSTESVFTVLVFDINYNNINIL